MATKSLENLINRKTSPIENISFKITDSKKESTNNVNVVADKMSEIFLESSMASRHIVDGTFSNPVMKTGTADFAGNAGIYELTLITFNKNLITAVYNANWIFRRIIDRVAQDMFSAGITINTDTDPDKLKLIYRRYNRLKSELIYAQQQARLYGGAASLIMIDDGETDLSKPLNLYNIKKGAKIRLQTTDRWYGVEASNELVQNYRNVDYGTPKYYSFSFGDGQTPEIKVHHTRVLRFINRKPPRLIRQLLQGWGLSELEHIYQELLNHDNTKSNAAALVSKALLEIVKIQGMRGIMSGLAMGNTQQEAVLAGQIAGINNYRTSNNLVFLDTQDNYEMHPYSFSGLSELISTQKESVAGAAEMPQVLLYGDTKGGLTSDSPAEMEFYAQTISGKQDSDIRPILDKLLPIFFRAEGLDVPKDLDYEFESIAGMPQEKKLNQLNATLSAVTQLVDAGMLTKETGLKEIQEVQKITGFGSNICDKDFELANSQDFEEKDMGEGDETLTEETEEETINNIPQVQDEDDYSEAKKSVLKTIQKINDNRPKLYRKKIK